MLHFLFLMKDCFDFDYEFENYFFQARMARIETIPPITCSTFVGGVFLQDASVCVVVENAREPQSTMDLRFLSNLIVEQRFVNEIPSTWPWCIGALVHWCISSDRIPTNSSP